MPSSELVLRALDPAADIELFRESFSWRTSPKKHVRVNRMPFEEFSANYSNQVVMGLWNGQLCAVYLFREIAPKVFESHFTSRKNAKVEDVFAGGKTMLNWFHSQGAEVQATVVERNRPLRAFVEALGFVAQGMETIEGFNVVRYISRG